MPTAVIDGIITRYEVAGSGAPVLMFSPGGFDATVEKWRTQGIYVQIRPLDHLSSKYMCIAFDRRESGESGGRVEHITWERYVAQGKGLLEHLGIPRAHIMGACMGCCPAVAFAVAYPGATSSLVLYWPVGGAVYRINGQQRFADHLAYVREHGLEGVVTLVTAERKTFNQDPRGGPWASVIRRDPAFAQSYARHDAERYRQLVTATVETLFDRDTAPGAEPEDLLRLDIPALVAAERKTFNQDPRGGPWASVIGRDPAFAQSYARHDAESYRQLVTATVETLFDRDTAPGAEPEDLLRLDIPALVVPGRDKSHATSAARYLEECLPRSEYWDVAVADQTEKTAPARLLEFLNTVS